MDSAAQELDPSEWFPLDIGSYWHYEHENQVLRTNVILHAARDSLSQGVRWVQISVVHCEPEPNCPPKAGRWYSRGQGGYVLFTSGENPEFAAPDTLLPTSPRSVFDAQLPVDTLESSRTPFPVIVRLVSNPAGAEADSTNLRLEVDGGIIFFSDAFVYRVGRATDLVGAILPELEYGDTSFLRSLALEAVSLRWPSKEGQTVYPNPSYGTFTLSLYAPTTNLVVTIYDLQGREVANVAAPAGASTVPLSFPHLSSGVFLVRTSISGKTLQTSTIVLIR